MRASDTDRERAVETLRLAAGEGRLDADELDQRLDAALAAKTAAELEQLTTDLPARPGRELSRRGMSGELRAYLPVMALLVAIWALTGAGYFWPVWPALGWGLGLMLPGGVCASSRPTGAKGHTPA